MDFFLLLFLLKVAALKADCVLLFDVQLFDCSLGYCYC